MINLLKLPERVRRRVGQLLAGTGPADGTGIPLVTMLEAIGRLLGSK